MVFTGKLELMTSSSGHGFSADDTWDKDDKGKTVIQTKMDKQPHTASHFAHGLRVHLWAEHMGLLKEDKEGNEEVPEDVRDQLCDPLEAYSRFLDYAEMNTKVYDKVFPKSPSDQYTSFKKAQDEREKRSDESYPTKKEKEKGYDMLMFQQKRLLSRMRGHICTTSLNFMTDDMKDWDPAALSVYGLMADSCFV